MGNASSKGKKSGATERIHATTPSTQEEKHNLSNIPVELLHGVGKYLTPQDKGELTAANSFMHSIFNQSRQRP